MAQLKHTMVFEAYQDHLLFNKIYEEWRSSLPSKLQPINEDEDIVYTGGDLAAFIRGDQVLTDEQYAALYLRALDRLEPDGPGYLSMVDGILDFGYKDEGQKFTVTIPAFADAFGLESDGTVSRTTTKFYNLLSGIGEKPGDVIYPKLKTAFEKFSKMNPTQIAVMASDATQDPSESTKHRDQADTRSEAGAASRQKKLMADASIGEALYRLLTRAPERFWNMMVKKVAVEQELEESDLLKVYCKWLTRRENKDIPSMYRSVCGRR